MTETMAPEEAGRYLIDDLLTNSIQPFSDYRGTERFDSLVASIRKHGLLEPIHITADRVLADGLHRLYALKKLGRTWIDAKDVTVHHDQSGRDGAKVVAVQVNTRRHMTTEERVEHYRWLLADGWSQGRIAKEYNVQRSAVSMLLKRYPDPTFVPPTTVVGLDGRKVDVSAQQERAEDRATDEPPKPKRVREAPLMGDNVRKEVNRVFAEADPALANWIISGAADGDREDLAYKAEAIGNFWLGVAESLGGHKPTRAPRAVPSDDEWLTPSSDAKGWGETLTEGQFWRRVAEEEAAEPARIAEYEPLAPSAWQHDASFIAYLKARGVLDDGESIVDLAGTADERDLAQYHADYLREADES